MSTVKTIISLSRFANKGLSLRDKWLAFLVAGLGSRDLHRMKLRGFLLRCINSLAIKGSVQLALLLNSRRAFFSMRKGNEGDYLIGGELVTGMYGYGIPDFEPACIIDGGANIGSFSISAMNYFPKAKLICYEPDSANLQQLYKNLALNKITAEVKQLALWSREASLFYHANLSHLGIVDENAPGEPVCGTVPEIGPDCWLKLDIEGSEYEVVPALLKMGRYPRYISAEFHFFDTKGQSVISLLREHGYKINLVENFEDSIAIVSGYKDIGQQNERRGL